MDDDFCIIKQNWQCKHAWMISVCMLCMREWVCTRLIRPYNGKIIETNMDRSESGPASQYKYLVTLNGDNITGERSNIVRVKSYNQNIAGVCPNRPKLKQKSPFPNWTKILFTFSSNSHCFSFACILSFEIPNFCLNCPFGFSTHREYIFFCMSLIFAWIALSGFQSTGTLIFA